MSSALFEIDHDNLTVTKQNVLDREVFTVDNFFKYPNAVSKFVEKLKMPPSEHAYPGDQFFLDMKDLENHALEVKQLLIDHGIDSERFVNAPAEMWGSRLVYQDLINKKIPSAKISGISTATSLARAGILSNPHTDTDIMEDASNQYVGICYLSKNSIHGGTGIYRNKKIGMLASDYKYYSEYMSLLAAKLKGKNTIERNQIILDNYKALNPNLNGYINEGDEYFERIHFFPMKFNRMIFYEGDMLHSMCVEDEQFYSENNTRQTLNYAFHVGWEVTPDERSTLKQLRDDLLATHKLCIGETNSGFDLAHFCHFK